MPFMLNQCHLYREYIEKELISFARENPGVVVYVKPRRHRSPCLKAEYCKYMRCSAFYQGKLPDDNCATNNAQNGASKRLL